MSAHPESYCHRCNGPNVPWMAPSPLWNAVMRGNDINAADDYDGIVCPTCFATLAEARVGATVWRLHAERVQAPLTTVTPSGRVWDDRLWLWVDPSVPVPSPEPGGEGLTGSGGGGEGKDPVTPPNLDPGETLADVLLPDGTHLYWSTHCRHAGPDLKAPGHEACRATALAPGVPRRPSQCKTCGSPCRCHCHAEVREDGDAT